MSSLFGLKDKVSEITKSTTQGLADSVANNSTATTTSTQKTQEPSSPLGFNSGDGQSNNTSGISIDMPKMPEIGMNGKTEPGVFGIQMPKIGVASDSTTTSTTATTTETPKVEQPKVQTSTTPAVSTETKIEAPQAQPTSDIKLGLATDTSEEQTKAIDELANTPVDVAGKTSSDIQDEIFERQKEIYMRDKLRTDQMNMERYSQRLAQEGFAGSGSREALMLMLEASNANGTANGLQQLQLANLQRLSNDRKEEEATMMNLFTQMANSGDLKSALSLADSMSAMDPDNTYWKYITNNPEQLERYLNPQVQARITQNRQAANELLSGINFQNPAEIGARYDEWKKLYFDSASDISAEREGAWTSISDADKDALYQEAFGTQRPSQMSEAEADEIYSRYAYKQKVENLENAMVGDTIRKNLIQNGATDEDLEALQDGMDVFLNSPESAKDLILNGITFVDGDINSEKGKFLFEDWYGGDYDLQDNKRSQRDQYNQDMDAMWSEYVKSLGEDEIMASREKFQDAVKRAGYLEGQIVPLGEIKNEIKMIEDASGETELKNMLRTQYGITRGSDLQSLDMEEMREVVDSGVSAGDLVKNFYAMKNLSGQLVNKPGTSDGSKKIDRANSTLGLEAINSGTYPRYIVSDGEVYFVGDPVKRGNNYVYTMKPLGDGGVEFDTFVQIRPEGGSSDSIFNKGPLVTNTPIPLGFNALF